MKVTLEENKKQKEHVIKLEKQIEFLSFKQNDEITKVENTINEFAIEIKKIKDENNLLKSKEIKVNQDVETLNIEKDKYKKEYKILKQVNKALEQDLREVMLE